MVYIKLEDARNYVAIRLGNSNSVADRVFCGINGAAYERAWSEILRPYKSLEKAVKDLYVMSNYSLLLAKIMIGLISRKMGPPVRKELLKQAKSYSVDYSAHLINTPSAKFKRKASNERKKLTNAASLEDVLSGLNFTL